MSQEQYVTLNPLLILR